MTSWWYQLSVIYYAHLLGHKYIFKWYVYILSLPLGSKVLQFEDEVSDFLDQHFRGRCPLNHNLSVCMVTVVNESVLTVTIIKINIYSLWQRSDCKNSTCQSYPLAGSCLACHYIMQCVTESSWERLIFIYVYVYVYMGIHMCMLLPIESRRGHCIPWSRSNRLLWAVQLGCWGLNSGPVQE